MVWGQENDRIINTYILMDRLMQEAENMEQFSAMLKAELWALGKLYSKGYYNITMEENVIEFPNADYVAVGTVCDTEEDFDDDRYGYIIPYSYIKDDNYYVDYKIMWNY